MACRSKQLERGADETMLRKMRKEVSQSAKASCETCETSETVLISMLQKELDRKNEQLDVKDKQIAELNARLSECSAALMVAQQTAQAAQALHAGTIQQRRLMDDPADLESDIRLSPKKKPWIKCIFFK